MNERMERDDFYDNGGRRSEYDRRQFSYTSYIPERRNSNERRAGTDRREMPRPDLRIPPGQDNA